MAWPDRSNARPLREGVVALSIALLGGWARVPESAYLFVFVWMPVGSTTNVMRRFASPAGRDWWLGAGLITRRVLARRAVEEILACSVLTAAALAIVRAEYRVEFERHLGIATTMGGLHAMALLFLLQVSARSALGCLRHLGTCTWLSPGVRATANGFRSGPVWSWVLLQGGVLAAVLAAPLVLGALRAQPVRFWIPTALVYPLLLLGMSASSEAIQPRLLASLRLADFLWWPRLGSARAARFAPRRGLLWNGLKPSVHLLSLAIVLLLVLQLLLAVGDDASYLLAILLQTLLCILVPLAGLAGPFQWKSEGTQAAYLHAAGIDHVSQRRAELVSGAVLALATLALFAWMLRMGGASLGVLLLLPFGSAIMLRSARGPVFGDRSGRSIATALLWAAFLFPAVVSGIGIRFGIDWGPIWNGVVPEGALAVALSTLLLLGTVGLTVLPPLLWLRAWRATGDEDELKVSIHG